MLLINNSFLSHCCCSLIVIYRFVSSKGKAEIFSLEKSGENGLETQVHEWHDLTLELIQVYSHNHYYIFFLLLCPFRT